jgi:two-component system, chemotaxis family, chemotaxis protein CheY
MGSILVVDDSMTMRKVIHSILTLDGYSVVEAADGLEGLVKVKEMKDLLLILTDVNMPNMDGITMCENIRQIPEAKQVPILVISTEGNADLKTRAKAAGVLAWMTKPPQGDKIREIIKKILSRLEPISTGK